MSSSAGKRAKSRYWAAVSNFAIQYNFSEIGVAMPLMKLDYAQEEWVAPALSSAVFAGAILGQVSMGYIADRYGRQRTMALTLALTALGALGSALLPWGDAATVYSILTACRVVLGIGAGGLYPLSATQAAEAGDTLSTADRADRVASAFFWQTPGALTPYIVGLLLASLGPDSTGTYVPERRILGGVIAARHRWRILFMLGSLPCLSILFQHCCRQSALCKCCSTTEGDVSASDDDDDDDDDADEPTRPPTPKQQRLRTAQDVLKQMKHHWRSLVGTGVTWFLYDVAYYGTSIFSPLVLVEIFGKAASLVQICQRSILVNAMGLPATLLTIYLLRTHGLRTLQFWGFFVMALAFAALAVLYRMLSGPASTAPQHQILLGIFCVIMFTLYFGPNVTTFVLPSEIYPREVRATFNGLSAAMGKLGAVVGTAMYQPLTDKYGMATTMAVCSSFAVAGSAITWLCVAQMTNRDGEYEYITVVDDDVAGDAGGEDGSENGGVITASTGTHSYQHEHV